MSGVNNSVETVNAAATAIISAESRVQQIAVERRRWRACFSAYWCFKPPRHNKRVNHAALVPEPILPGSEAPTPENQTNPPALALPFIAPPSSPVSFLQSESSSATLSPAGPLSRATFAAASYTPTGPASIFAIGPYAHETQLVSPPVFSTFTTEPSTASFTPPPEPLHLTTPSSPEVPFARLLTSSLNANCSKGEAYEFNSYQLYPGSPIGHLISPSSACSGTSSPFPDVEYSLSGGIFTIGEPPKILSGEGLALRKLTSLHAARNGGSLLDGQISAISPSKDATTESQNGEADANHRLSFELTAEEVALCIAKKPIFSGEFKPESRLAETAETAASYGNPDETANSSRLCVDETYHDLPERIQSSAGLQAAKEFKFDADGASSEPGVVGSDWWANKKVAGTETGPQKKWTFFPMIQPGIS
ncbi:hypothetical protein J5N97_023555 [Dioscorea zingiberensis]|uniref:Hydroxyproline-rich glycoprotein family protein n=1 Tax=Dioscorea zingiberensis TaxID=325984 RepID=A0A9D5C5A1_9LILI|nr:hypothetical protein J5N97_023555 [Dioscorea zingiberensis]